MRVTSGTVVDGRIEVPGEELTEGTTVTVLAPENDETFRLGPKEEAELLASIEEADRGDTVPAETVLRNISAR